MTSIWRKEFLTVKEVAKELAVSPPTAYRMIREGIIGHVVVGSGRGRIMIPRDEVVHYITSLKEEARRLTRCG